VSSQANFEMWKTLYEGNQVHEDDIPDEEVEWASTPEEVLALLRELGAA
jgi:hypothetical protein